jgi:mannose-6-phosphate isomerase
MLLDRIEGKESAADSHLPEDWIGSATRAVNPGERSPEEGIGRAVGADGCEVAMDAFFATEPEKALGPEHVAEFGSNPQLLVKLLDSRVRLHIQAHPTEDWARRHLGARNGKTEAWWVLDARIAAPSVILGFQRPPEPQEWRRFMSSQDREAMLGCFDPIPVNPGDVLLVPGGVPHAVGAGLLMVEVQEPTDYVVRCEYARDGYELPESARTMGLGIDRVLDLFDYTAYPADGVKEAFGPIPRTLVESRGGREEILLGPPQTDRFEVRQVAVEGSLSLSLDGRFSILIVLEGEGEVVGDGLSLPVSAWSRVLLPAALESVSVEGRMRAARCLPPRAARGTVSQTSGNQD